MCLCLRVCECATTSTPSLAHDGFLGLSHPVIFRWHGNGPVVTWKDQSAVRVLVGGGVTDWGRWLSDSVGTQLEGGTGETRVWVVLVVVVGRDGVLGS